MPYSRAKVVIRTRPPLPRELNGDRPFVNIVSVDKVVPHLPLHMSLCLSWRCIILHQSSWRMLTSGGSNVYWNRTST